VKAVALDLDRVLGDTRPLWLGWLEEAARRYASIASLDPASLPRDRGEAARELDLWAEQGIGDWRHALARYAEEHAPLHLRPEPAVGATLRALAREDATVGVFTDAPEPLARVALAHLGALRRVAYVEAGEGALERLLARLGPDAIVVHDRDELAQLGNASEPGVEDTGRSRH
jgi:phosphoglycolate phosphatase-like HAD superfamily hydrolase